MDENKPTMPTPENTAPQVPVSPQLAVPEVKISEPPSGDSKKMILWLVMGIIVIALLVGGIYFFLSRQQEASTNKAAVNQPVVRATPKPPVDTVDALDKDLNAINVENTDSDFVPIDQDLQQL